MTSNPIDRLIEAKVAKIASAERTIEKLKIEIAVLREARQAVAISPPLFTDEDHIHSATITIEPRRGRSLSEPWKKVLARIGGKGKLGASIDDIDAFRAAEGIKLERATLRAQLSNYVSKHGYLDRSQSGVFTLTQKGAQVAGYVTEESAEKEAEAPR